MGGSATSNLNLIIKATDETAGAISGIGGNLDALKGSFKTIAIAATAVFVGVSAEIDTAVTKASAWQDEVNQMNATLKSTGDASGETSSQLISLANALQGTTTNSNDAELQAESLLLTFTNIHSDTFPKATQAVNDISTALGESLTSAATQVGRALNDPATGLTLLTRLGITFTTAQKDQIKQMEAAGDAAGAQGIILDELSVKFGGSASAAAESFGGKMTQLQNQFDDTQKTIGTALIPVLTNLLSAILPVIQGINNWITAHPKLTAAILITVAGLAGLVAVVSALVLAFIAFNAVSLVAIGIIAGIMLGVVALVAITIAVIENWTKIKDFFGTIWDDIKKIFSDAINDIIGFFQPLIDMVQSLIDKIEQVASSIGSVVHAVGGTVSSVASSIGSGISSVVGHLAQGGSVSGGSSYLVGENGAEIFTPSTNGSVTPNNRLGSNGQNISISITGTFMSSDAASKMGDMMIRRLQRVAKVSLQ